MKLANWVTDWMDTQRHDWENVKNRPLEFVLMLIAAAIVVFFLLAPWLMEN